MQHNRIIQQYNQCQDIDRLPTNIIAEFKEILIMEIHKKLVLNFRTKGNYKCIFQGEKAYEIINPVPWNPSTSHNQSEEEVHPLEQLIYQQQSLIKKQARQPQFLCGENLIEWKKCILNEVDKNICIAGYIYFHFYISQSFM
ncbi:1038_t:CDS:2 [Entrophospora sp. SA101]|nr:1038_t:CDS:2 [Entrophospora sp. SA101]